MIFFLYQISGEKSLTTSYHSTRYVIKAGMGFLILALPLGIIALFSSSKHPVWDNIPFQAASVILMYIFAGLFEEISFRAVISDAIIYRFRDRITTVLLILSGISLVLKNP